MQIKGGWSFLGLWNLTLVSTGVGLCEAGFDCPALVFVTCPYFSTCISSSRLVQLFYGPCFIFSPCSEMSLNTPQVLCGREVLWCLRCLRAGKSYSQA